VKSTLVLAAREDRVYALMHSNRLRRNMRLLVAFAAAALLLASAAPVPAQDPVKVHPDNFKVEFQNAQVRVLRVTLAPHQKTDLHDTRDVVVAPLTDYEIVKTDATGKTVEIPRQAGKPGWLQGGSRVIEAGGKPVDAILVEIKSTPASPK
jgi:hypothetical protein